MRSVSEAVRGGAVSAGVAAACLLAQLPAAAATTATFAFTRTAVSRTCANGVGTLTFTDTYTETSATDGPHAVALGTAPANYVTFPSVLGGSSDSTEFVNVPAGRPTLEWITPVGVIHSKIIAVCPSAMTMSAPAHIDYGKSATFKADLTDATSHAPIAGATLRLIRQSPSSSTWSYVASATTSSTGVATLTISPHSLGIYRWRFSGSSTNASSDSPDAEVDVLQVVSIHAPSAVASGHLATIWGTVTPAESGEVVYLQNLTNGAWHNVATSTTARQTLPNGAVAIGYVFHHGAGTYRVARPATLANGRGVSRTIIISLEASASS